MCLGHREVVSKSPLKFADKYTWQTYSEVSRRRLNLGSAVEGLFRSGKAGGGELPTVAIWCINRPGVFLMPDPSYTFLLSPDLFETEWQIIDQANAAFSRVTVSLYDTLGPDVAGEKSSCFVRSKTVF
jgi:long-chain acyl-CoA synthetase